MRDIVADKILSFLSANNIEYSEIDNFIVIPMEHKGKTTDVFYLNDNFYIDKKDYVGQPHIILHWNPKSKNDTKDINKYGLCLTMDGSDRRNNELTQTGQIDRVKEIVFELWDDSIGERFRELNTIFQTKISKELYINKDEIITDIETGSKYEDIKKIIINFNGESKEEMIEIIDKKFPSDWVLVIIKYKGNIKKILFSKKRSVFKLNDFTSNSFWSRTGKIKSNNNAIIVGLGSVGGLVLDYLCRSGFNDITIYDDDEYDVVNNPRHVLGIKASQIGINKAKHLADYYANLYPMINIKAMQNKFKYDSVIAENTLIFNTAGGSHHTLLLNALKLYGKNLKKNFSFIDIFVEPFALGVHGIVFKYSKDNKKDELPLKYLDDDRYLVTPKRDFRKNFDGCFTPTLPYGFTPLQIAIPWLMTIMYKDNYKGQHYTIPFFSLFKDKKDILNGNLSKKIDPYRIGVKKWKK